MVCIHSRIKAGAVSNHVSLRSMGVAPLCSMTSYVSMETVRNPRSRLAQERLAAAQEKQRAKEETAEENRRQKLEDEERRRAQKLEDEERRRAQKLEDEARRRAERAAEAEQKKLERQREREAAAAKKKAERLQSKIETQLISAGGQILKRGLLGILKR